MTNARQARSAREKAAQMRYEAARKQSRQQAAIVSSAVAALLFLVVAIGVIVIFSRQKDGVAPANLAEGGMLVGETDAPITVEIFEDFICPVCSVFQEQYTDQFAAWEADGTVKIVYRPVAILDPYSSTDYSTRALNAFAAVLDTSPDAAEAYYDLLMENQPDEGGPGLSDDVLLDLAEQAGADRAAIEPAVSSLKYKTWIEEQNEYLSKNYQENGQVGTPTVVVDGEKLAVWSSLGEVIARMSSGSDGTAASPTNETHVTSAL
jgi:protein-disulfide isomerase